MYNSSQTKPIRVGFLIDSLHLKNWHHEIVQFVLSHSSFCCAGFIINGLPKPTRTAVGYRFLRKIDRTLFAAKQDPFSVKILNVEEFPTVTVYPRQTKFHDIIEEEEVEKIASLRCDLIIRFGFRIIKGSVLNICEHKIWSLHHGDFKVNRGGPPGFWEVVNKEPLTGVTLQVLTEDLDNGEIIDHAAVKTDYTSFNKNQVALYWSGVELFKTNLDRLAKGALKKTKQNFPIFYSQPLYKDPKTLSALKITARFACNTISRKITDLLCHEQWIIGYSFNKQLDTSLYRYKRVAPPNKKTIWADPFIQKFEDDYYLFAEEKIGSQPGAIICLRYEKQSKKFIDPKIVIKEKFHLSYPHIFSYNGKFYMMPETGEQKKLYLYEAESFPYKWKRKRVLVDEELYDATLFFHENIWYLFATARTHSGISANELLHIYFTDNPIEGEWKQHKQNPILHSVCGCRPAGKLFHYGGKIIRPSQIGAPKYGYGIQFYELQHLSPEQYAEKPLSVILPKWNSNILATHTFNSDENCHVIDMQRRILKV